MVQSSAMCDAFRFNQNGQAAALLTEYDGIWSLVRWLAIVSASAAVLAVMMCLLVILEGFDRQSQ